MSGWRKRQIHDSQMPSMQEQESNLHEPDGTHEGHWPQEALHMLRVPSSTPPGKSLLRGQPAGDVLRSDAGRREDRPHGPGSREGLAGDRGSEEQTK